MKRLEAVGRRSVRPRMWPPQRDIADLRNHVAPWIPREVRVEVEEHALQGFEARARWGMADGLETYLRRLLTERGAPTAWRKNPERAGAGNIRRHLIRKAQVDRLVAAAIHGGTKG